MFRSKSIDPWVFYSGAGLVILFVAWGVLGTDSLASVTESVLDWLLSSMGWVFVLTAAGFVAFAATSGSAATARCASARTPTAPTSGPRRGSR